MARSNVKVKVRQGRGRYAPVRIKAKMKSRGYIGGEAARIQRELDAQRAKTESLQRELDSLKCQIKIIIKEQK